MVTSSVNEIDESKLRPAYMNNCVRITETEYECFVMVINEEPWIKECKEPSIYQKEKKTESS